MHVGGKFSPNIIGLKRSTEESLVLSVTLKSNNVTVTRAQENNIFYLLHAAMQLFIGITSAGLTKYKAR